MYFDIFRPRRRELESRESTPIGATRGSPRHRPPQPATGRIYDETTVTVPLRTCCVMARQQRSRHLCIYIYFDPAADVVVRQTAHTSIRIARSLNLAPRCIFILELRSDRFAVGRLVVGALVTPHQTHQNRPQERRFGQIVFFISLPPGLSCGGRRALAELWQNFFRSDHVRLDRR
jgi:hypothetical protein